MTNKLCKLFDMLHHIAIIDNVCAKIAPEIEVGAGPGNLFSSYVYIIVFFSNYYPGCLIGGLVLNIGDTLPIMLKPSPKLAHTGDNLLSLYVQKI